MPWEVSLLGYNCSVLHENGHMFHRSSWLFEMFVLIQLKPTETTSTSITHYQRTAKWQILLCSGHANTSSLCTMPYLCIGSYRHVKEYYLCGQETAFEAACLMQNWPSRDRVVGYSINIKALSIACKLQHYSGFTRLFTLNLLGADSPLRSRVA